jgi:hemolysin III
VCEIRTIDNHQPKKRGQNDRQRRIDVTKRAAAQIQQHCRRGEELFNSLSHGLGAGLSVIGLAVLVIWAASRGDALDVFSFSIYGASLVLLYLASTLYHSIRNPRWKLIFRRFDHAAIYVLIAGTYTPFLLVSLGGAWGWSMLGLIWGLALLGVAFKTLFIHRFERISTVGYNLMGWLGVLFGRQVLAGLSPAGLAWLAAGGVTYTLGVIFYAVRRIPYNHAIWHLFVLGGSICHFIAVCSLLPGS